MYMQIFLYNCNCISCTVLCIVGGVCIASYTVSRAKKNGLLIPCVGFNTTCYVSVLCIFDFSSSDYDHNDDYYIMIHSIIKNIYNYLDYIIGFYNVISL